MGNMRSTEKDFTSNVHKLKKIVLRKRSWMEIVDKSLAKHEFNTTRETQIKLFKTHDTKGLQYQYYI